MYNSWIANATAGVYNYMYRTVTADDELVRKSESLEKLSRGMRINDLPTNNWEPIEFSHGARVLAAMAKQREPQSSKFQAEIAALKDCCSVKDMEIASLNQQIEIMKMKEKQTEQEKENVKQAQWEFEKRKKEKLDFFRKKAKTVILKKKREEEKKEYEHKATIDHSQHLQQLNSDLLSEINSLKQRLAEKNEQVFMELQLRNEVERLQTQMKVEMKVADVQKQEITSLKQQIEELKAKVEEKEQDGHIAFEKLKKEKLNFFRKKAKNLILKKKKEEEKKESELKAAIDESKNLEKQNSALFGEVKTLMQRLAEKNGQESIEVQLRTEVERLQTQMEAKMKAADDEINTLKQRLANWKDNEESVELQLLKNLHTEIKAKMKASDDKILELKAENISLKEELHAARTSQNIPADRRDITCQEQCFQLTNKVKPVSQSTKREDFYWDNNEPVGIIKPVNTASVVINVDDNEDSSKKTKQSQGMQAMQGYLYKQFSRWFGKNPVPSQWCKV